MYSIYHWFKYYNLTVFVHLIDREIAEQFTNCTLMSYIPPYSGQAISGKVTDFDLLTLDQDLRKWYVYNDNKSSYLHSHSVFSFITLALF